MVKIGDKLKNREQRREIVEKLVSGEESAIPQPPETWIAAREHLEPLLGQVIELAGIQLARTGDRLKYINYIKKNGQRAEFVVLFDDARVPVEKGRTEEFELADGEAYQWRIMAQVRINAKLVRAGEITATSDTSRGVEF